MNDAVEPSRRERLRSQTIEDIKTAARRELDLHGGHELSLRSVARSVGMTPSALYRYFSSRDDLITELVIDGFDSLAHALHAAAELADQQRLTGCDRWLAVARAHRAWALQNPSEYAVVYGRQVPGYQAPPKSSTMMQSVRSGVDVMFGVMIAAIEEGSISPDTMDASLSDGLRASMNAWNDEWQLSLSAGALALCMHAWTQLHGFINLEMYGHFPPHLTPIDDAFDQQMRAAVSIAPIS
jgi:AcrR family transcriptional regulator